MVGMLSWGWRSGLWGMERGCVGGGAGMKGGVREHVVGRGGDVADEK